MWLVASRERKCGHVVVCEILPRTSGQVCAASHPGELTRSRRPLSELGAAVAQVRRQGGWEGPGRRPVAKGGRFDECAAERGIGLRLAPAGRSRGGAMRSAALGAIVKAAQTAPANASAAASSNTLRAECSPPAHPGQCSRHPSVSPWTATGADEFSARTFDRSFHLGRHRLRCQPMIERQIEIVVRIVPSSHGRALGLITRRSSLAASNSPVRPQAENDPRC
jgi:hypothetical protein